jgi:hypothetical protein
MPDILAYHFIALHHTQLHPPIRLFILPGPRPFSLCHRMISPHLRRRGRASPSRETLVMSLLPPFLLEMVKKGEPTMVFPGDRLQR